MGQVNGTMESARERRGEEFVRNECEQRTEQSIEKAWTRAIQPYTRWDGRVRRGTYHAVIDWEARDCTGCGTAWMFTAGRMGWGVGGWARRGKVGKEVKQRRRR